MFTFEKNDPRKTYINHISFILDEIAPFKKLSRGETRLKCKPWISQEIICKVIQIQ